MGKSTVASMFADEGVPVFDADAVVHHLQGPEGALVAEIESAFPGTTGAGGVDRDAPSRGGARRHARRSSGSRRSIHPAVAREREKFLARAPASAAGGARHPFAVRERRLGPGRPDRCRLGAGRSAAGAGARRGRE